MPIMPIINNTFTSVSKRVIKGKVHPRTGHDGPEGGGGRALLFL